ncbi:right-handed parallel beta-helix repeat-containing protein [Rhizorhapis sp. SPR117]|uniref:right-handed parallel beta-helix repeat-containing protein n=1 Tax=Rhizorhapis sp. SPR117 TaxID=2912611 RepID=UPI001F234420|nr:right-handed parallel beta-helix repeat-containing protein [Rhizorhapis sp. SPR117]
MALITVSSSAALVNAVKNAADGDVIQLEGGNYGKVSLSGIHFANGIAITSADADHPAVLTGLKVTGSSGLDFDHIEFALDPADKYFPITVGSSSDVHFSNLYVHGLIDGDPSIEAMAMMIRNSSDVSVTDSKFQELHHAVNFLDSDHITISGNSFQTIRSDGVRGGGTSDLVISDNYFTDFHPVGADHPDAIQLWTTNTTESTRNVTITGNVIERGDGGIIQGIFLRDQSGGNVPYEHVTISDNIVLGGMYNGISVGNTNGLIMTGNTVGAYADQKSWLRIENSTAVELTGNAASAFILNNDAFIANHGNSTTGAISGTGEAALKAWLDTHPNLLDDLPHDLIEYHYPAYDAGKVVADMAAACDQNVIGTDGADRLYVDSAGATHIMGGAGNDVLNGGAASCLRANLLEGGMGDDIYVINNALDHVVEAAGAGIDEVQSRVDFTLGENVENLRLQGSAVSGTGNGLANVIRGNDAANVLKGLGGDDLIYGGGGNDSIDGGTGNDRLYGDAGKDVIHSGAGDDLIYGGDGDDILYGDAGNDLIEGGMGSDRLYGGAGVDQFSYRPEHLLSAGAGMDIIADFSSAQGDKILLAMLDADSHTAANDKFSFIGTDQFTGEAGQLRYALAGGDAYVCGDVNGDGMADFTICVAGVTSLGSGDFSL